MWKRIRLTFSLLVHLFALIATARDSHSNTSGLHPPNSPNPIFVEALWDAVGTNHAQAAIQAGESITFVCRIWRAREPHTTTSIAVGEFTQNPQSVFLFCPLSIAYCAQDCLLVDHTWPIKCTRQFRSYESYQIPSSTISLPRADGWELQEVIYKLGLAVVGSSGLWTCAYAGINSNPIKLRVRDRPVLLSFTSNPQSPVVAGTPVNLTCQSAPSPNAPWYNFVWRRIGSRIPPAHSTIRLSDTVSVLTLSPAQSTDDGTYSCRVTRDTDSTSSNWWSETKAHNGNGEEPLNLMTNGTNSPEQLTLKLDVYHPPTNLTFATDPPGPHLAGSTLKLTCRIYGGKPEPDIQFYRSHTDLDANAPNAEYFNFSESQKAPIQFVHSGMTILPWTVQREDNDINFGCAATGTVIAGRIISKPVKLSIIFPPGPPILTAFPQSAVSENRTRIFKCRSSSGSNPPALVKWKLFTSVDYITSSGAGGFQPPAANGALDRLLSGSNGAHIFEASEIDDFQADTRSISNVYQDSHHRDPTNRGYVAYGEVRLISRPWYNGARVSCHLEWPPTMVESNKTVLVNQTVDSLEFLKPVYLTTEVFFAPSTVTLSVDPRNGIQEFSGQQIIECTTTSSIPQAQITWLRRQRAESNITELKRQPEVIGGTLEDPLETFKEDEVVQEGVNMELLPGLYGGKRVISRLTLSNVSRTEDGTVFICKVTHVEWLKSVGRLYRLVVLYPPTLHIQFLEPFQLRNQLPSLISLKCIPNGGRPAFPDIFTISNRSQSESYAYTEQSVLWNFSWSFHPTFPVSSYFQLSDQQAQQEVSGMSLEHHFHSVLTISRPQIKDFGEYTCHLNGPGGSTHVTKKVEFAFPPELVPPGATVFTATVGAPVVLELYVWSFPFPTKGIPTYQRYFTPTKPPFCRPVMVETIADQAINHSYIWFKVPKSEPFAMTSSTPRQILTVVSRGPNQFGPKSKHATAGIWSDLILVNLASQYFGRTVNVRNNLSELNIPTLVYRLFLSSVTTADYGEYMLEVDHLSGRKTFLARLQPPASDVQRNTFEFTRSGSTVQLRFDPNLLETQMNLNGKTNHVNSHAPPAHKRDTQSGGLDRKSVSRMLLRVCTLSAPTTDRDLNTDCDKLVSMNTEQAASPKVKAFDPPFCIDQIVSQPEKGFATVDLSTTQAFSPSAAALPWYLQRLQPVEQRGTSEPTSKHSVGQSEIKVALKQQRTPYSGILTADMIDWTKVERLTYQLRFYNVHGTLLYSTEWLYENTVSLSQPKSTENAAGNKPSLGLLLWLLLVAMLLIAACSIILLLIVHRKRRRKREISMVVDQRCMSLKNSLGDNGNELFDRQPHSLRLDNFYVANTAIVDSPCPMMGRREKLNDKIKAKSAQQASNDSANESMCSPNGSFQFLPAIIPKESPVYGVNNTAVSFEYSPDPKVWRTCQVRPRRASVDETDSIIFSPEFSHLVSASSNKTSLTSPYTAARRSHPSPKLQLSPQLTVRFNNPIVGPLHMHNKCFGARTPYSCSPLMGYTDLSLLPVTQSTCQPVDKSPYKLITKSCTDSPVHSPLQQQRLFSSPAKPRSPFDIERNRNGIPLFNRTNSALSSMNGVPNFIRPTYGRDTQGPQGHELMGTPSMQKSHHSTFCTQPACCLEHSMSSQNKQPPLQLTEELRALINDSEDSKMDTLKRKTNPSSPLNNRSVAVIDDIIMNKPIQVPPDLHYSIRSMHHSEQDSTSPSSSPYDNQSAQTFPTVD